MLALSCAFALLSAPDAKQVIADSWQKTLVIGHRGAASMHPENTLPAFDAGMRSGAVGVECDVHMSQDGVPVVIHDKTIDRTFKGKGVVKDLTMRQLHAFGVPSLDDVVLQAKGRSVLIIEIKDGKDVVEAVARSVRQHQTESQTIIFSFNGDYVRRAKALLPNVPAVWLVSKAYEPDSFAQLDALRRDYQADAVGFSFKTLTPELAAHLRLAACPLFVWTVPPGEEVTRLASFKVNFIITDHPKEVVAQLASGNGF